MRFEAVQFWKRRGAYTVKRLAPVCIVFKPDPVRDLNSRFASVTDWSGFMEAVAPLSDTDKGTAFERLVAHYLRTNPIYQSKLSHVWLLTEVPAELKTRLRLPTRDMGIDLIAETPTGEFWAIQAKFRTDEDASIPYKELSTFSSLAFHICAGSFSYALVCTTTIRITGTFSDLTNLGALTAEIWAALPPEFFTSFSAPTTAVPPPLIPRSPREHQSNAVAAAIAYYAEPGQKRGKLIHPCGSGKSLTAYWIARDLGARRVLIAVPSLALVRQTLETWMLEAVADHRLVDWLCVCSDDEVAEVDNDALVAHVLELGIPCDTNPHKLAEHLRTAQARPCLLVVLTTYQSSQVLAEAATAAETGFDFAVFDEAHKTTGSATSSFAHLLHDKNLPLARRLFMTATERRFASNRSDDIVSMDDPDLYGETIDLLTFKAAIAAAEPILCDYRLLTIGVREYEIKHLVAENRWLDLGPDGLDEVTSLALASLIALCRATERHGVRHTVSFHNSILRAARFRDLNNRLNEHLAAASPLKAFHVTGKMGSAARQRELKEFLQASPSLITNARCLTEGVDVPGIDCVFFADSKGSTVDIVQASGRALRLAPGKKLGYILLPLVVPDGMTPAEIAEQKGFDFIFTVLRALASQDERIIDWFRATVENKTSDVGCPVSFDFDQVVLPIGVSADDFAAQIEVRCWDKISQLGNGNWDLRFEELVAYQKEHGNVQVPRYYAGSRALTNWLTTQRSLYRNGKLWPDRASKLEKLGVDFGASHEASWMEMFEALRDFHAENDHCKVPTTYRGNLSLGTWVGAQRQAKDRLAPDRIKLLESVGFTWDLYSDVWFENLNSLKSFKEQHGHCNVPQVYAPDPKLGRWVIHQRSSKAKLSADKISRLDELGFDWDPAGSQLEAMFVKLDAFKAAHGHCDVPQDYPANPSLGAWLDSLRRKYRVGKMPPQLIQRLDLLGVVWAPRADSWSEMFSKLQEFKNQNGHCNVTAGYPQKSVLGAWVDKQRSNFRRATIAPDRKKQLDDIGFVWNALETKWTESFAELNEFKALHGHCRVPQNYPPNPKLKTWVTIQRREYLERKMDSARTQKLEAIGFDWDPLSKDWETRFSELVDYKAKHAHCSVPARDPANPTLGRWLANQRAIYRNGSMDQLLAKRLEDLGVTWTR